MDDKHLFTIKNLSFSYYLGSQKIQALRDISISIPSRSLVTFTGPSGSGKSTLLNILGLIEPMQKGQIFLFEDEIGRLWERQKNRLRKYKIGFIFQQFHLIPVLSAEENVRYFLARQGLSRKEVKRRSREALESVGLWEHRMKKPLQLSGGQRQRVAIARALAKDPEVIIADEPTASLDQQTGREIMDLLQHLVRDKGVSIVLTTHDPMVRSYADTNFHMQDGQIIREEQS